MKRADMNALTRDRDGVSAPSHTITLSPDEFSSDWPKRPSSNVVLGLRMLPSEEDKIAKKTAAKSAIDAFPDDEEKQLEEFSLALQAWAVARSVCDPNNTKQSHPSIPMAEETIRAALTGPAITRIFDEIEKIHIETSPIYPEATDEQLGLLAGLLATDGHSMDGLSDSQQGRVRRLAGFILSEILDSNEGEILSEDE